MYIHHVYTQRLQGSLFLKLNDVDVHMYMHNLDPLFGITDRVILGLTGAVVISDCRVVFIPRYVHLLRDVDFYGVIVYRRLLI